MLRLISIIGIAIAMVIGFVAISSKMKDDYTVRSRIVDVIEQMKNIAADELQCAMPKDSGTGENTINQESASNDDASSQNTTNAPEIEITKDLEPIPLVESADSQQATTIESASSSDTPAAESPSEETPVNEAGETVSDSPADAGSSQSEQQHETALEDDKIERNSDIVKSMGYRVLRSGAIEVLTVFKDIYGESGKTLVQSGNRIAINCKCDSSTLSCTTVISNINKNYLPKSLTKQ